MDARTVAIDSKDLESGIEALSSAGRAFRLTLFEKCAYYALMASVYVTGWSFVAVIFLAIIDTLFEWNVTVLGEAAAGIVFLGAGFAIVALALNMPLAYKLYRERALLKQLGLASLSKSLWKESRRGRWISRVFRWAALIMLVVSVPVMAIDHYSRGREWDAGVI
jgi:hypothetical protein